MADISVNLKTTTNQNFTVTVNPNLTVSQWKQVLETTTSIPAQQQRLIYAGQVLKDEFTVAHYKIQEGHTVHLVRGAARATPPAAAQPAAATPNQPQPTPQAGFPTFSGYQPAPAAGNAPSPFGLPPMGMGMDMSQLQQQMMNNPEMLRQIMDSPMFQSMMNNPELLRNLMSSNPNIQALIDRNPELGHVLNDPQLLRQSLEVARNPALMREMMRNQDTAMRNIETHPEGFNALRRMFNEVQDPLMQAAAEGFQQPQPTSTNTAASAPTTGTPNTAPLPNPWAAPAAPAASASPFANLFGSAPAAGTQQPPASNPFAGLDQMPGMAGMGGMPGISGVPGMLDPQQALQMLQNPFVQNMMQQMAQNPQMFQFMIQSNPMLRQMMESNPFVAQMMNDPAALQQMLNPQAIQAALQFASMMPPGFGAPPAAAPTAATPNPAAPANPPQTPFNFGSMWGPFMGGAGAPAAAAANTQPPEVRWATELVKLEEMGFYDRTANIAALQASNGNVHAAVERLLANL